MTYQSISVEEKNRNEYLLTATSKDTSETTSDTVREVRLCPRNSAEYFMLEGSPLIESEGATDSLELNTFDGIARISFK